MTTLRTNPITIKVISTQSCGGCPSGDVCPDSNGACPSGYQLDPNNINCCMPVCSPQSCPSGQYWDTTTCSCQDIVPSQIVISPSIQINQFWSFEQDCLVILGQVSSSKITGFTPLPSGTEACQYGQGNTANPQFSDNYYFEAKLIDAGGNPVPNFPMTGKLIGSDGMYPYNNAYIDGTFLVDLAFAGSTDANGNFKFSIVVGNNVTGHTNAACPTTLYPSTNKDETTSVFNFTLQFATDSSKYSVPPVDVIFEVTNTFCVQATGG